MVVTTRSNFALTYELSIIPPDTIFYALGKTFHHPMETPHLLFPDRHEFIVNSA